MENLMLTTGQFAKMCKTTKHTIYFYTEEGLLHGEKSQENGYVYYSFSEYFKYLMINDLRMCDFSIKEIKEYLSSISPENILKYLQAQQIRLSEKINEYQRILDRNTKLMGTTLEALNKNRAQFSIQMFPDQYFFVSKFPAALSYVASVKEISDYTNLHMENCTKENVDIGYPIISVLDKKSFLQGICMQTGFGSKVSDAEAKRLSAVRHFPCGKYVVAYHDGGYGDLEAIKKTVCKIDKFLKFQNYEICGDGYRYEVISHSTADNFDDFIMKFIFPVKAVETDK